VNFTENATQTLPRKLTDKFIQSLKPRPERFEVRDGGCAGLVLRVGTTGRKAFYFSYRYAGTARRMTLGKHPGLTLTDARILAASASKTLEHGENPGRSKSELSATQLTVQELVELYLKMHARPRKASADEDERKLNNDVVPLVGSMKLNQVKRYHIANILDGIVGRGAPIQANRTLEVIRKMFNFAIGRGLLDDNPCSKIPRPSIEVPRKRYLSEDEVTQFWSALESSGISRLMQLALQLMLVTAQRRTEVLHANWSEIEFDTATWRIPGERTKNKQSHRVPLSDLAIRLLEELRALNPESEWLFPSPQGNKPVTERAPNRAMQRCNEHFHKLEVSPHVLRHTAASHMTRLGHSRLYVEKILNHADASITATYDHYGYDKEKRAALEGWASDLEALAFN
jgi:integrase